MMQQQRANMANGAALSQSAKAGEHYTKHIYIGCQRIVSKIGDFTSYGASPRRIQYAGKEVDAVNVDYDVKYSQQLQDSKENYAIFGMPYNGKDNDEYADGEVIQHVEYVPFG